MDTGSYMQFVMSLALVLGLIFGLAWVAKRFNLVPGMSPRLAESEKTLKIQESLMLDPRHRLLLVRRGDVGHLLLLGPTAPTVLESGIVLSPAAKKEEDAS